MTAAHKRQVRDEVTTGQAGIVIGTHALLSDSVEFSRLGLVVVDEQHRFGVEQRDRLRAKAPEGLTPHLLVMTATPIPRTVALTVFDTDTVIEKVGRRELELGVVGAQTKSRAVVFEPFLRDEVVLAVPARHRFAGRTVELDELLGEHLILMQEGAGVRRMIEDELRAIGRRLKDFDVHLELGLQESVKAAVLGGYGVTFISRTAIEAEIAAGTLGEARVAGLEPSRDFLLVRAAGRPLSRAAEALLEFAQWRTPAQAGLDLP